MMFEKAEGEEKKSGEGYENDKRPQPGREARRDTHTGEKGDVSREANRAFRHRQPSCTGQKERQNTARAALPAATRAHASPLSEQQPPVWPEP
ncbi:MAG: hypothetical protein RLZZ505_2863 [Verrucomicrobiota bacterium]